MCVTHLLMLIHIIDPSHVTNTTMLRFLLMFFLYIPMNIMHVHFQHIAMPEAQLTQFTFVWHLSSVYPIVHFEVVCKCKPLATNVTFVWPFSRVAPHVFLQVATVGEEFAAYFTRVESASSLYDGSR